MIGASIFGLCLWLKFEPGIEEWLSKLNALEFYIGVYILIGASIIIMIVAFVGCASALQESSLALLIVSTIFFISSIQNCKVVIIFKKLLILRFMFIFKQSVEQCLNN